MLKSLNEIGIEITSNCNLDCKFCSKKHHKSELELNYIIKILNHIKQYTNAVRITGGEPLLHPNIIQILQHAKKLNLYTILNTNGTLLTQNTINQIESLIDNLLISFNTYTPQKLNSLSLLTKSKIKKLRIGCVLTKDTLNNLDQIFQISKQHNIQLELFRPMFKNKQEDFFTKDFLQKTIKKLLKLKKQKTIKITNALPFCAIGNNLTNMKTLSFFSLGAKFDDGHTRLIIDSRNFVKPSYFIEENLGSPLDIKTCLNTEYIQKINKKESLNKTCQNCLFYKKCLGGSRQSAKLYFDNYFEKDNLMSDQNECI